MQKKLFLFLIIFCFNIPLSASANVNIYPVPRTVPNKSILHESGKRYKLSDFKGEFLVVVFWSKKCSVCIKELDDLNGFYNAVKSKGVKLIVVSPSGEWKNMAQTKDFLVKRKAPDLEVYWDEGGELASGLGIFALPHNVLINKKGEEIGRIRGGADWDDGKVIKFIYELKNKHG